MLRETECMYCPSVGCLFVCNTLSVSISFILCVLFLCLFCSRPIVSLYPPYSFSIFHIHNKSPTNFLTWEFYYFAACGDIAVDVVVHIWLLFCVVSCRPFIKMNYTHTHMLNVTRNGIRSDGIAVMFS